MSVATYQDLCIDANDARLMADFWAAALDLEVQPSDSGVIRLTGPTPRHTVWINAVPEPLTVKQRMHVDVNASSVDDVLALGATALDLESFPWKVLRDPEGGEMCVFERGEVAEQHLMELVVDTPEGTTGELAGWWADLLGGARGDDDQGRWSWVESIPDAPFESLVFVPVPEPKTVKNRIHVDVTAESIEALTVRGATVLRARDEEIRWTVLADPAGNEFCAFTD